MKTQFAMILSGRHTNGTRFDVAIVPATKEETDDRRRFFLGTKIIDGIEFFWRVVISDYAPPPIKQFAIKDNGVPVASGDGYASCSKNVDQTKIWDMKPGTSAPYCITTIGPWHPEIKKLEASAYTK